MRLFPFCFLIILILCLSSVKSDNIQGTLAINGGLIINFTSPTETSGSIIHRSSIQINVTASSSGIELENITIRLYNSTRSLINSSSRNNFCYQETANVSTVCGGLDTGNYVVANQYFYINYTKPVNTIRAIWQVKHGNSTNANAYNITLPAGCMSNNTIALRIYSGGDSNPNSYPQCYNYTSSTWITVGNSWTSSGDSTWSSSGSIELYDGDWGTYSIYKLAGAGSWKNSIDENYNGKIYEEAMIWNFQFSGFTNLADGLYLFNATVYDNGNSSSTETRNVTLTPEVTPDTRGGGGGGGSYGGCSTSWSCTAWNICLGGKQTRTCSKLNEFCNATSSKPLEQRLCYASSIAKGKSNGTRQVLFDINIKAINKEVLSGKNLNVIVGLINLGVSGRVNASLYYKILDSNNAEVYSESEIVPVETQLEFIKEVDISFLPAGNYKITADMIYKGQKEPAHAEALFTIGKPGGITGAVLGAMTSSTGIVVIALIAGLSISMIIVSNLLKKARLAKIKALRMNKSKAIMLKSLYKS